MRTNWFFKVAITSSDYAAKSSRQNYAYYSAAKYLAKSQRFQRSVNTLANIWTTFLTNSRHIYI